MINYFSHRSLIYLSYAFFYAVLVTLITIVVGRFPVLLQIENTIYDSFQRYTVAKTAYQDWPNRKIPELEQLVFFNLNDDFIDTENGRVRRNKLADLIQHLGLNSTPDAVFLDYLFIAKGKSHCQSAVVDSLLSVSLQIFGERLVLPYEIKSMNKSIWFDWSIDRIEKKRPLLYQPSNTGYITPFYHFGDRALRYMYLTIDQETHSAVYALLKTIFGPHRLNEMTKNIPSPFEINYLIDTISANPEENMIELYEASQIMKMKDVQLKDISGNREKIFFIGLFNSRKNVYESPIDEFKTPLHNQMNGVYIIVNAFLNVLTNTYLRSANCYLIFALNFFLAFVGAIYCHKKQLALKNYFMLLTEILLTVSTFIVFLFSLYWWMNIKFPFVITTLIFVRNQYFFRLFNHQFFQKSLTL